jgi:nicotinate-nucleotide adenylyltransferase
MRLGIFGGTFDPIHLGHLILAEHCRDLCRLDRILFVPAGQPPHKAGRQITPAKLRLEMVELAIAGHPAFTVSPSELNRTGPSYSADTLEQFAREFPGAELFFLIGSDSLADLPGWYQPSRILSLATLVVANRPGAGPPNLGLLDQLLDDPATISLRTQVVEIPLVHISSSCIRARVASGRSIRYLVPRAVECFIAQNGIYGVGEEGITIIEA